ncbi:MAG: cyanophycin synthetase CphA [Idiomarinaceae bacterium HL-53]|nr:MAG: cyanophycin synthetase CphA [Idiomarinaceae bacterium HL-53]CUS48168.1 D-alanine-D-alanine ligase [Idiomarinaceae bacterium HL-53]
MENCLPPANEYHASLHLYLSENKLLSLNAFLIAEDFQRLGFLPIWSSTKHFSVPAAQSPLQFSGAHIASGNHDSFAFLNFKEVFRNTISHAGISVARGQAFDHSELVEARAFALTIDGPIVIKPTHGNKGRGATIGLTDMNLFEEAFAYAKSVRSKTSKILIEEQFTNCAELRLLVIEGQCVGVVRRIPPRVLGDRQATIAELIARTNIRKRTNPNECTLALKLNSHRRHLLAKQGYTEQSVPASGVWVKIDDLGNISEGADSYECKELVHSGYIEIAEKVAKMAAPVVVVGVDMLVRNIKEAPTADNYIVIEANSGPAITGHTYPTYGKAADIVEPTIDYCFEHAELDYGFDGILDVRVEVLNANPQVTFEARQHFRQLCQQYQGLGVSLQERRNAFYVQASHSKLRSITRLFEQKFGRETTALCFFSDSEA